MLGHELVVKLPPRENVRPVTQVVGDAGQPVPPSLHHRLGLVHRVLPGMEQGLVYQSRLVQLHDLIITII